MKPIGTIHTPFTDPEGMPIQPAGACGVKGSVEVFEEHRTPRRGQTRLVVMNED